MERLMRERGDLKCFHEPFMYDYYVARSKRVMPYFKAEKGRPVTYCQVRDVLMETAEKSPVFVKDMSYYVIPHIMVLRWRSTPTDYAIFTMLPSIPS